MKRYYLFFLIVISFLIGTFGYAYSLGSSTSSGSISFSDNKLHNAKIELVSGNIVLRSDIVNSTSFSMPIQSSNYLVKFSDEFQNDTTMPTFYEIDGIITPNNSTMSNISFNIQHISGIAKTNKGVMMPNQLIFIRDNVTISGLKGFSEYETITDNSGNFNAYVFTSNNSLVKLRDGLRNDVNICSISNLIAKC